MRMLENAWTKIMMNETLLFDSLSSPIPEVRRDLQIIPINDNGRSLFYFHDPMSYSTPNFALDQKINPILSLITGSYSISQIVKLLNGSLNTDDLLDFVQLLDQHRVLNSKHFRIFSNRIENDFEASAVRKSILLNGQAPDQQNQLSIEFDHKFAESRSMFTPQKGLYAPHIDLKVGGSQYIEAFSSLKDIAPKRVVILGTSHYAGYYGSLYEGAPFIGSEKTYQVKNNAYSTDQDYIAKLVESQEEIGFSFSDRAHRIEHSIEMHLMMLNHIWNHEFTIVPILIAGFDELFYHSTGQLSKKIARFSSKIRELDNEDTFYLISGDLSHVGRKFGDPLSAKDLRTDVELTDHQFIDSAQSGDAVKLLDLLTKDNDSTRICGYPPLYTFLNIFPGIKGEKINYQWWDESERDSAVSFGSIAY